MENENPHIDVIPNVNPVFQANETSSSTTISYLDDLKNTLDFDRKCRVLETLFNEINERVSSMENELRKHR